MEVRRGDLVTVALQGDYGKPRPALVIQADQFADLGSVVILHHVHAGRCTALAPHGGAIARKWIAQGVTDHAGQAHDGEGQQDRHRFWPPR